MRNAPTGQTSRRIFTHDGANDVDSRKDVPFLWIFSHCSPFRGSKTPKTLNFGAWIGVFKPNSQNRKTSYFQNYCIDSNQILHSDKDHQMPFVGGPHTRITKSKMADGRHLGKIKKLLYPRRGATDFDQIWHGEAFRTSWPSRPLKIRNLKNPRWRRPPFWKI